MHTLKKLLRFSGLTLVIAALALSSQTFAATNPIISALFETSLAGRMLSSDTSMILVSNKADPAGNTLPSGYTCFTIDGNNASNEFVCGTVSGTSVTGLTRGLSYFTGTTTLSTLAVAHARGADVKITDYPGLIILNNQLRGVESIVGPIFYDGSVSTTTIGANRNDLASVGLVQDIAFNGASVINATTGAKGIVQIATQADAAASTALGTSGATVVLPASLATSTYNAATASGRIPVTDTNGHLPPLFVASSTQFSTTATTTLAATSTVFIGSLPAWDIGKEAQYFTSTGTTTFSVPSGIGLVSVEVIGGGGQGGSCTNAISAGGGGGAGGYAFKNVNISATSTIQVFVGAGSQWSTFGTNGFYTDATPGSIGATGVASAGAVGGVGGVGQNGDLNAQGAPGGHASFDVANINTATSGEGGSSRYGGGATSVSGAGSGNAGGPYGGGGSGASCSTNGTPTGGVGGQGAVIVRW